MTAIVPKPMDRKPREYPRPVSPVFLDDLPLCGDTIIYCDAAGDIPVDRVQRAAKKRRIESYAKSYLRGEQLFIVTAQLKGPFENGWQNPWAKSKKSSDGKPASQRAVAQVATMPAVGNLRPSLFPIKYTLAKPQHISRPCPAEETPTKQPSRRRSKDSVYRSTAGQHHRENHKEDWLKRNNSQRQRTQSSSPELSPSRSHTQSWIRKLVSSPTGMGSSVAVDAVVTLAKLFEDPPFATTAVAGTGLQQGVSRSSPPHIKSHQAAVRPLEQPEEPAKQLPVPSSLGPSGEEHSEPHRCESPSLHTAPEWLSPERVGSGLPSTTEASKASSMHELPSAQLPLQSLHSVPSNLLSNSQLLQEVLDQSPLDRVGGETNHQPDIAEPVDDVTPTANPADRPFKRRLRPTPKDHRQPRTAGSGGKGKQVNSNDSTIARTTTAVDTMTRVSRVAENSPAPITRLRSQRLKNNKRASNITDEPSSGSKGSIKSAMKVTKPSSLPQGRDPGLVTSVSKSFPHSSLAASVGHPLSSSNVASLSTKQDAQRPLEMIENDSTMSSDDGFDLNAAMSDLSNFLGPWDPEKAAAELAQALS